MSEQAQAPAVEEVVIDSVDSLFTAMRSDDLGAVLGIFRAISEDPEAALAMGKHMDKDVIDEMIHQSYQRQGITFLQVILVTLAAFDDERVVTHFLKLLHQLSNYDAVQIIAGRLALEPVETIEDLVRPLLMQEQSRLHAAAAADLLHSLPTLTAAERLRVSVANSIEVNIAPPIDAGTVDEWLSELNGWYAPRARILAASVDEASFLTLASRFSRLSNENREWLLGLGVQKHPLAAIPVLREGLKDDDPEVVLAALSAISNLGPARTLFAAEVTPLVANSDVRIKIAAIHAGAQSLDYRGLLADESTPELISRVLERYTEEPGADPALMAAPFLRRLAHSWGRFHRLCSTGRIHERAIAESCLGRRLGRACRSDSSASRARRL